MHRPEFIADAMLGRLAKWLRILGYRAYYFHQIDDGELVRRARELGAILLTRDTRLVQRRDLGPHLFVRDDHVRYQLKQVVEEFGLPVRRDRLFTVCVECNEPLTGVDREAARGLVPPYVYATQKSFSTCQVCGRIYWGATHQDHMLEQIKTIFPGRINDREGADPGTQAD